MSSEKKNNEHNEHHFCPILYLRLLESDVGLNRSQIPLHVCAMILEREKSI